MHVSETNSGQLFPWRWGFSGAVSLQRSMCADLAVVAARAYVPGSGSCLPARADPLGIGSFRSSAEHVGLCVCSFRDVSHYGGSVYFRGFVSVVKDKRSTVWVKLITEELVQITVYCMQVIRFPQLATSQPNLGQWVMKEMC